MNGDLWPLDVRNEAERVFGGSIHNVASRTHQALDRRIAHALKVWRGRYQMNFEQELYASEVLTSCIRLGAEGAASLGINPRPQVYSWLDRAVHSERVHAGFKRREALVNVRDQMEALDAH